MLNAQRRNPQDLDLSGLIALSQVSAGRENLGKKENRHE